jgi:hypothetical protein
MMGIAVRLQRQLKIFLVDGLMKYIFDYTVSRPALGPTQPPTQWLEGALSLGLKRPGREADHSPPSSAEIKECVEQYFHSPRTPTWRGAKLSAGTTLPFYLYLYIRLRDNVLNCSPRCLYVSSSKLNDLFHVEVLWVVMVCSVVVVHQRVRGPRYLSVFRVKWRWSQHGPPKRWHPTTTLHGVTTLMTATWNVTAVKASSDMYSVMCLPLTEVKITTNHASEGGGGSGVHRYVRWTFN